MKQMRNDFDSLLKIKLQSIASRKDSVTVVENKDARMVKLERSLSRKRSLFTQLLQETNPEQMPIYQYNTEIVQNAIPKFQSTYKRRNTLKMQQSFIKNEGENKTSLTYIQL